MENMQKDIKSFKSRFLKMAAVTLSNFKWPQLQYFLDDSLHLNTKIINRICSFQNFYVYLKIPQNELALVLWEWVTYVRHFWVISLFKQTY